MKLRNIIKIFLGIIILFLLDVSNVHGAISDGIVYYNPMNGTLLNMANTSYNNGTPQGTNSIIDAKVGKGRYFASDTYFYVNDQNDIFDFLSGDWAVQYWINDSSSSDTRGFTRTPPNAIQPYMVGVYNNVAYGSTASASWNYMSGISIGTGRAGTWILRTMGVINYGGSYRFIAYENNTLVNNQSITGGTLHNVTSIANIGGFNGATAILTMDEFKVWKGRYPTVSEIGTIYTDELAGYTYPLWGVTNVTIHNSIVLASQSPADFTAQSLFGQNLNITYNFTNESTSLSQVQLNYSIIGKQSCLMYDNGICNYINATRIVVNASSNIVISNNNSISSWILGENTLYPHTQIANASFLNRTHQNYSMTNQNQYFVYKIINVTNSQYNIFEAMALSSSISKVYICNSSFNPLSGAPNPSTVSSCNEFSSLNAQVFNHTHNLYSSHNIFPFKIVNNKVNGIGVNWSSTMWFVFRGSNIGTVNISYVANTSYAGYVYTTNNNGATWSVHDDYVGDYHLHQYSGSDYINYYAQAFFNSTLNSSDVVNELIDLGPLVLSPPIVTNPFNYTIQNTRYMNITFLNSTPQTPGVYIDSYSIRLINSSTGNPLLPYIKINNSLNNSYYWDVYSFSLPISDEYAVDVCGTDTLLNTVCDSETFNLTRNGLLRINAFDIVSNLSISPLVANVTDTTTNITEYWNTSGTTLNVDIILNHTYNIVVYPSGFVPNISVYVANGTYLQNMNLSLYRSNFMSIVILDEITSASIKENVTLVFKSETYLLTNYTLSGDLYTSAIPSGDYSIIFTSENYSTRTYYITLSNTTVSVLVARLLLKSNTTQIGIYTKTLTSQVLPGVLIIVQRQYFGGSYATVAQLLTDISGFGTVNVESGTDYRVILSAGGYQTKQFGQQFYTANSPYTYQLTPLGASLYIYYRDGVQYYYTPSNTTLNNGTITFSISTFNASSTISWTAVNTNGTIVNVSGSPAGGTASNIVNLNNYGGSYPVVFSFNYYNANTGLYRTINIPITYWIECRTAYNATLPITFENFKISIGSSGWTSVLASLIILIAVLTIIQISGNIIAGVAIGIGVMIFLAFVGWISPALVGAIAVISILSLFMQRSGY